MYACSVFRVLLQGMLICLVQTQSTLSFLEPFRRAPVGIPFLYQKVDICLRPYV